MLKRTALRKKIEAEIKSLVPSELNTIFDVKARRFEAISNPKQDTYYISICTTDAKAERYTNRQFNKITGELKINIFKLDPIIDENLDDRIDVIIESIINKIETAKFKKNSENDSQNTYLDGHVTDIRFMEIQDEGINSSAEAGYNYNVSLIFEYLIVQAFGDESPTNDFVIDWVFNAQTFLTEDGRITADEEIRVSN